MAKAVGTKMAMSVDPPRGSAFASGSGVVVGVTSGCAVYCAAMTLHRTKYCKIRLLGSLTRLQLRLLA